jgi:peptidoglycan hydrolase CwlO-like protein
MTIEVALLISVVSVSFAIYQGVANLKRNQKTDERSEATQLTTVIVKLESIGNGITEIKNEINNVKKDIKEDRERIVKLEVLMEAMFSKKFEKDGGKL